MFPERARAPTRPQQKNDKSTSDTPIQTILRPLDSIRNGKHIGSSPLSWLHSPYEFPSIKPGCTITLAFSCSCFVSQAVLMYFEDPPSVLAFAPFFVPWRRALFGAQSRSFTISIFYVSYLVVSSALLGMDWVSRGMAWHWSVEQASEQTVAFVSAGIVN
jgi:hypothetical protein